MIIFYVLLLVAAVIIVAGGIMKSAPMAVSGLILFVGIVVGGFFQVSRETDQYAKRCTAAGGTVIENNCYKSGDNYFMRIEVPR